jgi:hypothetical protein
LRGFCEVAPNESVLSLKEEETAMETKN